MPDVVELQTVEVSTLEDPAEYRKARMENKTVVEVPVEKPAAEPEKIEESVVEEAKVDAPPEEKPKRNGGGPEKRIDHYAKLAKEAEAKVTALQKELDAVRNGKKEEPAKPPQSGKPNMGDYDGTNGRDYERYLLDTAKWEIKEDARVEKEALASKGLEERAQELRETFLERAERGKAKYSDFSEVVDVRTPWPEKDPSKEDIAASSAFHLALVEDENSDEVMYYLGKHREELEAMYEMTPAQIVKTIGRISDKFVPKTEQGKQEEKPKTKSKAPEPIEPVNTASTKNYVPIDKIEDPVEYKARRRAQLARA